MDQPVAVILAAGKGTRMKSEKPKVLVEALGRPMIHWVLDAVFDAGVARAIVVVGYRAESVESELAGRENVSFALQENQLGTGHAVMMCVDQLQGQRGPVLILTGDSPLVQSSSLRELLAAHADGRPACVLGTAHRDDPTGLGRIVRDDDGHFVGIVEEKDASDAQRAVTEVNMSTYVFSADDLLAALPLLRDNNRQQEYYITDCPAILKSQGKAILALPVLKPCEALSVNTLDDLAAVEQEMQRLGY
ncbi:MAG: NTP transferase domain-containing protein, partial [Planctomycetales bacterium]|nr:NTP transferase domain-containing protein [Planctomycetales bacterium]